jgi:hypothetical protein
MIGSKTLFLIEFRLFLRRLGICPTLSILSHGIIESHTVATETGAKDQANTLKCSQLPDARNVRPQDVMIGSTTLFLIEC